MLLFKAKLTEINLLDAAGRDDLQQSTACTTHAACSKGIRQQSGGVLQLPEWIFFSSICFLSISESVIRGLTTDSKLN